MSGSIQAPVNYVPTTIAGPLGQFSMGGSNGGGGASHEYRLTKLEAEVDGIKGTLTKIRDDITRIDERLNHMPSKTEALCWLGAGCMFVIAALTILLDH